MEAVAFDQNTLFFCTKLRTLHIENSLGKIEMQAAQALVQPNHIIKATSVTVALKPHTGQAATATAHHAELSPTTQNFTLYGNVHAQQHTTKIFTDKLSLEKRKNIIIAEKFVQLRHQHGNIDADSATIDLKNKTMTLTGNVISIFNVKPAHKPQQ